MLFSFGEVLMVLFRVKKQLGMLFVFLKRKVVMSIKGLFVALKRKVVMSLKGWRNRIRQPL